jgi:hypothetical protein
MGESKRSKEKVFKKFDKDQLFVVGGTAEERAQILYIRSGLAPHEIQKRLKDYGEDIPITRIRGWAKSKKWKEDREKFRQTYSAEVHHARARKEAEKDVSNEEEVREVYSQVSGRIINSIKQKLDLAQTPDSPHPVLSIQDLASLSVSLEVTQKVHFKALGIPELIKVDPTSGYEGIRLLTAHDDPKSVEKSK